ncbi:UDP-N-acetylglucosamine 4,6-dehydratase family protein [Tateyamaria armeniaca]|uniref:UDP-N-acetylglucosamine 4,6-dehydratase family protein n=1 Tax=Tateyamaria armeniaca TaxID=2518930 RepID=A0ABW8UVF9_9RHOB
MPPTLSALNTQVSSAPTWPPVDAKHLLGRDEIDTSLGDEAKAYEDRVVLVSGAGGSIGSELVRQVFACKPRKIVLFELNEMALYEIHRTILAAVADTNIEVVPVLGSVCDGPKVRRTLRRHKVQVILHAAAYKHVALVEQNPLAGLSNNVMGTHTLITEAVAAGVERFVLISSDKAVRPTNVMGASKRLCELVVQDFAKRLDTSCSPIFAIVRFGNVLGSSGSVLPLFQEQVRMGGPVTVTHPDVSRYLMTVQEAVHLVLHAGSLAKGGEVFVLDMGPPVQINALARHVIHCAGLSVRDEDNPTGDIEIQFTGLRCGEKMSEELTHTGQRAGTRHPKIFTAIEKGLSEFEVAAALRALRQALADEDEEGAATNACRWVEGLADRTSPPKPISPVLRKHDSKPGFASKSFGNNQLEVGHQ